MLTLILIRLIDQRQRKKPDNVPFVGYEYRSVGESILVIIYKDDYPFDFDDIEICRGTWFWTTSSCTCHRRSDLIFQVFAKMLPAMASFCIYLRKEPSYDLDFDIHCQGRGFLYSQDFKFSFIEFVFLWYVYLLELYLDNRDWY